MPHSIQPAFISYSRDDSAFVLRLTEDLQTAGAGVWLDQLHIRPGALWDADVESGGLPGSSI